jgi:hypothetical protein
VESLIYAGLMVGSAGLVRQAEIQSKSLLRLRLSVSGPSWIAPKLLQKISGFDPGLYANVKWKPQGEKQEC